MIKSQGKLKLLQGKFQPAQESNDKEVENDDRVMPSEYMKCRKTINEEANIACQRWDKKFDSFGFSSKAKKLFMSNDNTSCK